MKFFKEISQSYKGLPREIYIVFICRMINSMGTFVFPLLSLILTQKIGFTKAQAGIFVTLLAIMQVPSLLIGGKLADTLGRKKVILIFQSLGAFSYMICGFIKPSLTMAITIVFAASFYGMAVPAFDAVSADVTTPKNRKQAFSLLYMGYNIGFAMAPIIGGLLYKNYLSLIFIFDGITTILSLILFATFIKETMKKKTSSESKNYVFEKNVKGSAFSVLLKRPILIYFALIMFVYQFVYSQWGFTLPLQMGDIFGNDGARLFGMVAGFNGIVVIVFSPIITILMRRVKPTKVIACGGVLYAIAFGMLSLINNYYFYFISIFILTIGEVMISINKSTFIANNTPASHRARISSIVTMITGAGFALGPIVMGGVVGSYGYFVTWTSTSILILIGAILMRILAHFSNYGN